MIPAPSPVLFSQPHAPRCSMFSRIVNASETIWCDLLLLIFATKPIPHASRSNSGAYNPLLTISMSRLDFFQFLHAILDFILSTIASNQLKLHNNSELIKFLLIIVYSQGLRDLSTPNRVEPGCEQGLRPNRVSLRWSETKVTSG